MSESHGGEGSFDGVDPRLNVFALANGMDLAKDETSRRLLWYADGSERALLIEVSGEDAFRVTPLAWPPRDETQVRRGAVSDGLSAGGLSQALPAAIDVANAL